MWCVPAVKTSHLAPGFSTQAEHTTSAPPHSPLPWPLPAPAASVPSAQVLPTALGRVACRLSAHRGWPTVARMYISGDGALRSEGRNGAVMGMEGHGPDFVLPAPPSSPIPPSSPNYARRGDRCGQAHMVAHQSLCPSLTVSWLRSDIVASCCVMLPYVGCSSSNKLDLYLPASVPRCLSVCPAGKQCCVLRELIMWTV